MKILDSIIKDAIKSVYVSVDENIDRMVSKSKIKSLRKKYIENLKENTKYIFRLPYMTGNRLLDEVFIELYAFDTPRKYRLKKERSNTKQDVIDTISLMNRHKHTIILGEPGAGKTTFLRHVAYSISDDNNSCYLPGDELYFPIIIECRKAWFPNSIKQYNSRSEARELRAMELQNQGYTKDYIEEKLPKIPNPIIIAIAEYLRSYDFPYSEKLTQNMLEKGNIFLFVDGIDEASVDYRPIISDGLEKIKKKYPNNRMILTCRTAEADNLPSGFTTVEISPLSELQKQKFVNNWFAGDGNEFLLKLTKSHVWNISDRPLLLTLLCALYQAGGDIPKFKVDIYQECAELALRKWDGFRSIKRKTSFENLAVNQRMRILSDIASEMMLKNMLQADYDSLSQKLSTSMEESGIEGKPEDLLEEFIRHSGLLQQVAVATYSFSHKSLQEFFAAKFFAMTNPFLPIKKFHGDRQWLGTMEMTACMVPDATEFIDAMFYKKAMANIISHDRIELAIDFIYKNPITISIKGRKKLIDDAIDRLTIFKRIPDHVVVIDNNIVSEFNANGFKQKKCSKINIITDLAIYIFSKQFEYKYETLEEIGAQMGYIFRLLLYSHSTIQDLLANAEQSWIHSLLMSSLIQSDWKMERESTKKILTPIGNKLYKLMEFVMMEPQ